MLHTKENNQKFTVLFILVLSLIPMSYAFDTQEEYHWKLRKDDNGIKVYTSRVANSKFKAVKAHMRIKATIGSLVAIIQDAESCSKWADRCKESRVIETVSDNEYYLYAYNNIPFPARDRDILAHIRWFYSPDSGEVLMKGYATSGRHPKTKAVRIENARTQWRFIPQEDGYTLIENFAHADPNGPIPPWLVNMMATDSPFNTLSNIKALIEAGEYDDQAMSFLSAQ